MVVVGIATVAVMGGAVGGMVGVALGDVVDGMMGVALGYRADDAGYRSCREIILILSII